MDRTNTITAIVNALAISALAMMSAACAIFEWRLTPTRLDLRVTNKSTPKSQVSESLIVLLGKSFRVLLPV